VGCVLLQAGSFAVLHFVMASKTWCYSLYILQASLEKNAAQDTPKHAISNKKCTDFLGSGSQNPPPMGRGHHTPPTPPHPLGAFGASLCQHPRRFDAKDFGVSVSVMKLISHEPVCKPWQL